MNPHIAHRLARAAALLLFGLGAGAAGAEERWLFDRFSIEAGARSNSFDTTIRIDAIALGMELGTTIDVEDGLGLESEEDNYDLALDWRVGRRHLLSAGWASHDREGRRTLSDAIQIGDTLFPVDVTVHTSFDIETLTVQYHFYPVLTDRTAFGVGVGARRYEVAAAVSADLLQLAEAADVSGPMPYLGIDFRYGIAPRWRLRTRAGAFDIEIDELSGTQLLAELAIEYKALKHLGLGIAGDLGQLDVETSDDDWAGKIESDIVGFRAFVRALW